MLGSNRVRQNTSLPLKNARLSPLARAATTLSHWLWFQYSSWPEEMKTLCPGSSAALVDTSRPEM